MPIYEYECRKCKAHVEVLQKITDKPLVKCTKCGGRLEKQWSPAGFQFKGSGWYVTDYAGKKADGKEEKTTTPTAEAKSTETTATETPAAASSAKAAEPKSASKKSASSSKKGTGD